MSVADARAEGTDPGAYASLPAINRPGVHATPNGPCEVSAATFADAVLAAIPADAHLYRRGEVVGVLAGAAGSRRFDQLDADRARLLIDRHVRIVSTSEGKPGLGLVVRYESCSKDLAGLVLAAARASDEVPELKAIVPHPVYLPGWTLARPGFNADAGVFYDEPDHLRGIRALPGEPRELLDVLDDVVDGFPYRDEASRDSALALILTLATRPAIDGNVPGFLIRAHAERTGKTYLIRTCAAAVTGGEPALIQIGSTEEERDKRISSELLRARPVVVFDNLPAGEEVDSSCLAMLFTAPRYTGRILGVSKTPSLPNAMTVILTGNNVGASGEVAKRLVPIHLEATTATPQDRTDFPHEDPVAYAKANQRRVLGAVIGIVEAWKAAGRPMFTGVPFGGFAAWTKCVGGLLVHGGSTRFLANLSAWQNAADPFTGDATALLGDWYRSTMAREGRGMSESCRARDLFQRAETLDVFARFRQGATQAASGSLFGKRVLGVLVDRIFAVPIGDTSDSLPVDVRVRKHMSGATTLYALEVVKASEEEGR